MAGQTLTGGIVAAMRHLSDRQQVLARNVANADTPGYKAREMAAPDFSALVDDGRVAKPRVVLTDAMRAMGAKAGSGAAILDPDTSETKPDGNNVTLEDQLMKMGQLQADFATLTNLYRKEMGLLRTALGKGHSA